MTAPINRFTAVRGVTTVITNPEQVELLGYTRQTKFEVMDTPHSGWRTVIGDEAVEARRQAEAAIEREQEIRKRLDRLVFGHFEI